MSVVKTFKFIGNCICILVVAALLPACKEVNNSTPSIPGDTTKVAPSVHTGADVYIAGYKVYPAATAVYWKNGVETELVKNGQYPSKAMAIAVNGTDVYVAGLIFVNGVAQAVYWKNGNMVILGIGEADAIAIQGTDVYIAGVADNNYSPAGFSVMTGTCWKNGVPTSLRNPLALSAQSASVSITGMTLAGSDVYISGTAESDYFANTYEAVYWKNGVPVILPKYYPNAGQNSRTTGISVNGSDVYVSGAVYAANNTFQSDTVGWTYWKNGNQHVIASKTSTYVNSVNAISIQGNDLYWLGITYNTLINEYGSAYWKNGVKATFPSRSNFYYYPVAMCFNNNDMYVAGYISSYNPTAGPPYYSKNGTVVQITTNSPTIITSLAVSP